MAESRLVRDATVQDAAACAALSAPDVRDTVVPLELAPSTAGEMAVPHRGRARAARPGRPGGTAAAWSATRTARRSTPRGHDWSTSVSVHTGTGRRRTGAGRALCTALLDRLPDRGHLTALAGVALPDDAGVGLRTAMGLEPAGTYRRVGWEVGRWHDVTWFQRPLDGGRVDDGAPPVPPS